MKQVKIIDCPRDAMQGIHEFIPTDLKIKYINALLEVGFSSLDFGSFVSPKAIPQLSDTAQVIPQLIESNSKLLAIVANERGAEEAAQFSRVNQIGFPFSVSEQFQLRNTNSTRKQSLERVKNILEISRSAGQELRVYLSMAFGNPYQEEWSENIVLEWAKELVQLGVKELVLSDTVGVAQATQIKSVYQLLNLHLPSIELNCHFHSRPDAWKEKIEAATKAGCIGFDGALKGFGGCPMADDELVGNLATENLLSYFSKELGGNINQQALQRAALIADEIFLRYH